MSLQHTLASEISATDAALHSDVRVQITLKGAPPNSETVFVSRARLFRRRV